MAGRTLSDGREPTVCFAMIARNEHDNMQANLPAWRALGIVDAIVVGIDDRSTDSTAFTIVDNLPETPHWIFYYHFEGFGQARSRVLQGDDWLTTLATSSPPAARHLTPPARL